MFRFTYEVQNAGWADGSISNGEASIAVTASYLNDSLGELASAALLLNKGDGSATVVFMNEPGEHQLIIHRAADQIAFEVRWFMDWASWGMYPSENYESLLQGQASFSEFLEQVRSVLSQIWEAHGFDGYRAKWIEHDFPIEALNALDSCRTT